PEDAVRARCVYNGLALPDVLPTPLKFDHPELFCIGRLTEEKGFHYAIAAFAKIRNEFPGCQLKIVGSGPEERKLKNFVSKLQLNDSVQFLGKINFSDIAAMMNQATLILMPSTMESFGLVALEAAQMQRPVIAAEVGGLPEVVVHQETGILIPP